MTCSVRGSIPARAGLAGVGGKLALHAGSIPARAGELVMSLAERHGLEYPCWRGLALQPGSTSPPSTGSMS